MSDTKKHPHRLAQPRIVNPLGYYGGMGMYHESAYDKAMIAYGQLKRGGANQMQHKVT
jgi:hypothetical protein